MDVFFFMCGQTGLRQRSTPLHSTLRVLSYMLLGLCPSWELETKSIDCSTTLDLAASAGQTVITEVMAGMRRFQAKRMSSRIPFVAVLPISRERKEVELPLTSRRALL